jgi:hypothetical protein
VAFAGQEKVKVVWELQRFVNRARYCPGGNAVDFSAVFVVLVEGWPLGYWAIDRAAVVVGDTDGGWILSRVCHNRDTSVCFLYAWWSKAIELLWSVSRSLCRFY